MRALRLVSTSAIVWLLALVSTGCSAPGPTDTQSTATLINTYWKLLSVNGEQITVAENQREPHFVLHRDGNRVAGFAGCNHLMGRYRTQGDELEFDEVGSTLMACEHGMPMEGVFLHALRDTARWKIDGEKLELFDAAGKSLAKFESVYLK